MARRRQGLYVKVLYSLFLAVTLLATGCSTTDIDNDSPPDKQYEEGTRLLSKDRYLEAVERFRILKSRYPYSKYAALAALKIGDAHFQEEAYLEAASAYKVFRDLYPRHEKSAYALFQIAESNYKLMPGTTDRDLEPAQDAIYSYTQLLKDYPHSEYEDQAQKRITELRGTLAEKEEYVGNYYFIRDQYRAAAGRYDYLLETYPDVAKKEENYYRLAYSWERLGEFRKAESVLTAMDDAFPDHKDASNRTSLWKKVKAGLEASP